MARKTAETPKDTACIYLLKGRDDARKQKELEKLISQMVDPSFADFDLEMLDGDSITADRLSSSVTSLPFASDKRTVVVRHANRIPTAEQEAIAAFLPQIPNSTCLIFVVPAPELSDGKPKKGSELASDLSKAVSKLGKVTDFSLLRADAAEAFVMEEFAGRGKKAERTVANLLVRRAGTDTSVLTTEVDKLVSYTGEREKVTAEDVNSVTTETPEEKVFALVDAVAAKNEALALQHLGEVFSSGGRPEAEAPRVLVLLARQYRLLWQFMYLRDLGYSPLAAHQIPEDIMDSLPSEPSIIDVGKRQSWLMDKLSKQARNFERKDLERGFMLIMATDAMLKGIEGEMDDSRTAMELLVLGLCRRKALK